MFKDYYAILDISEKSSLEQIREAFKKQAIKWHPDKNVGFDTTEIMQDINEAYLILKDPQARLKYDAEYQSFKSYKETYSQSANTEEPKSKKYYYREYIIKDIELSKWMKNAAQQAIELAKETIKDFGGMMKEGCMASSEIAIKSLLSIVVATILWFILFGASKSCN